MVRNRLGRTLVRHCRHSMERVAMPDNNNSHKTAIARKRPSAPCRWLYEQGRIVGQTLDWGCGRGADLSWLDSKHVFITGYDPCYRPKRPQIGLGFQTILCTYVLNTIPNYHDRCVIITEALAYLKKGGWIYITIRADKKNLNGWTRHRTWQEYVGNQLKVGGFEILRYNQTYEIWGWQMP